MGVPTVNSREDVDEVGRNQNRKKNDEVDQPESVGVCTVGENSVLPKREPLKDVGERHGPFEKMGKFHTEGTKQEGFGNV